MYDDLICELPTPDGRMPSGGRYQTKSLGSSMSRYTITAAGRLIHHHSRYEDDDTTETGAVVSHMRLRRVPVADVDRDYHGDVVMYGVGSDKEPARYVARFTHGMLEWIRPYHTLSEVHRDGLEDRLW